MQSHPNLFARASMRTGRKTSAQAWKKAIERCWNRARKKNAWMDPFASMEETWRDTLERKSSTMSRTRMETEPWNSQVPWCSCTWKRNESERKTERMGAHMEDVGIRAQTNAGLLGIEELNQHPTSLQTWANQSMNRSTAMANDALREEPSPRVIHVLDEISDTICQVLDAAELLRNVHQDRAYVSMAQSVCEELTRFVHGLNSNAELYRAVKRTLDVMNAQGCTGDCETFLVGKSLKTEFEAGGVHLSASAKKELRESQELEYRAAASFLRNLTDRTKLGNMELPVSTMESHLPKHVLRTILDGCPAVSGGVARIATDSFNVSQILKWIPDETIRKQAYMTSVSTPLENQPVLDTILAERSKQARFLGHDSYRELVAKERMAKNSDAVVRFLKELSSEIGPQALDEYDYLSRFKKAKTGDGKVYVWDYAFFSGMAKAEACSISAGEVNAYFHVQNCMEGMGVLAERLFGLKVKGSDPSTAEVWAEGVRRLDFTDKWGQHVGTMYLDLYPRLGKFNHAAHFTVRCGIYTKEGVVRPPIVALVCNFQDSNAHLLTHQEVETLFHEYGHAMHSLLSRTRLQHLSGTRGALDFVEIPSHLFEHFAWDHRFLRCFARHHETQEVIPRRVVEQLRSSKKMFHAMDMQTQIVYAIFDQCIHGDPPPKGKSCSTLFRNLHNKHSVLEQPADTNWHLRFGHVLNYGGAYYSYVLARILSRLMWDTHFDADPLSEEAGQNLANKLLGWGGARDPSVLLQDYVGRQGMKDQPKLSHFLVDMS